MACTTKQQSIQMMDTIEPIKSDEKTVSIPTEVYDEDSRKMRKHMAYETAVRQLEQRKSQSLVLAHRVSFIR
ncbi:MAG: hypothetical protein ACXAEF_13190 [Candidatus Thorarchaeota archaeon]